MISDIVLLKKLDLPDAVIDILETYGSCVTGAIIKDDYLNAIKGAGFINVKITDESIFPTNLYVDSPDIKQIIENIDISLKEAKKIIKNINNSIASIKVYGEKPLK